MSEQISLTLEELKSNPELATFLVVLEERLNQRERTSQTRLWTVVGVLVTGIAAMATFALPALMSSTATTIKQEVLEDPEFIKNIELRVANTTVEVARNNYKLAEAIVRANSFGSTINNSSSFSRQDADAAISAIETALNLAPEIDQQAIPRLLALSGELAQSFSRTGSLDLVLRLKEIIGDRVFDNFDFLAAFANEMGPKLAGSPGGIGSWEADDYAAYKIASKRAEGRPEIMAEYDVAIEYKIANSSDVTSSEKINASAKLTSIIDELRTHDPIRQGDVVYNMLLLTEPAVFTEGGEARVRGKNIRTAEIMRSVFEEYGNRIGYAVSTPESRTRLREKLLRRAAHPHSEQDSGTPLRRLFARACLIHQDLCSGENFYFLKNVQALGIDTLDDAIDLLKSTN